MQKAKKELPDVGDSIKKTLNAPVEFFDKNTEIYITRAPGRLDVMGGIADYSGSLVLEMPIVEATFAALQKTEKRILKIVSEDEGQSLIFEISLDKFNADGKPVEYSAAREYFTKNADPHWAAYIAGIFLVLTRECGAEFKQGANILISSTIRQGKGVSSSAALEAAVRLPP